MSNLGQVFIVSIFMEFNIYFAYNFQFFIYIWVADSQTRLSFIGMKKKIK